jgi:hypothetical protein
MPTFLQRVHGLTMADVGLPLGLAIGVGGGLGAMLGGAITARAAERDPRAFLSLPALTMMIFAGAMVFAIWSASLVVLYSALFVAFFMQFYLMGPYFAVVQRLAPLRGRAVATAVFFLILAKVGLGNGPADVGGMSDQFGYRFGDDAYGQRLAMMTLPVLSVIAGAIAFLGRNAVLRDADKIGYATKS